MIKPTIKNKSIANLYATGKYTTEQIAIWHKMTVRNVQRIAKAHGVIRSQAEANKLMAPLKHYKKIPVELRVKRKGLSHKLRFRIISEHPYCSNCGSRPDDGIRLEVDHIDENPSNNELSNLQVLCQRCNTGKSHLARFDKK